MRHHAFAAAMGFATAVLLASASQSQAASADPTGYWMKPDAERESKIQVFKCGTGKKLLCAKIAWLKDPHDRNGKPLTDIRNENTSLRNRQIVGLTIFTGLAPSAPSTWTGKIYNPEDGKIYSATLTVVSRSKILLKGCKAWLLCGERHWLRTSAPPEELKPSAPVEGGEQIEASVEPAAPPATLAAAAPSAEAAPDLPSRAPAPEQVQAMAAPEAPAVRQPDAVATVTPVALVSEKVVENVAPVAEYNWQQGYGFLSLPNAPDTAKQLSGEDVSSMMVMAEPVPAETEASNVAPAAAATATKSGEPVAAPQPKPKAKPKPVIATAAASTPPAAKPASGQAAPAPQEANTAQVDAESADEAGTTTAEAAMVEEVPLTRRQRRLLRRQQQQADPFLPWLR